MFSLDKDRKLRYSGRIDDDPADGPKTSHDAAAAICCLTADQPVTIATTPATGCSLRIGPAQAVKEVPASEPVTVSLAAAPVLTKLRHNPTGKLLLVNFYATWCGPCVTEFPDLMATNRMYRSRPFSFTERSPSNVPAEQPQVLKFLQKTERASTKEFALVGLTIHTPCKQLSTPTSELRFQ